MPSAPVRPCSWPGCGSLVAQGRCEQHRKKEQREYNHKRGGSTQQGYGYKWQQYRERYLRENPMCVIRGPRCMIKANEVDHIKPHKGDQALFWDPANHQAVCKLCHSSKTAKEDGRWGGGRL